jgi:hypothetical protein
LADFAKTVVAVTPVCGVFGPGGVAPPPAVELELPAAVPVAAVAVVAPGVAGTFTASGPGSAVAVAPAVAATLPFLLPVFAIFFSLRTLLRFFLFLLFSRNFTLVNFYNN